MQNIVNSTLGFKVNVAVPSTVEEYDQLAGKAGAALESANMNVVYRSWNNQFREAMSDHLAAVTSIKRETEIVLNKDGSQKIDEETKQPVERYTETAADHVDRVFATLVKDGKAASVEAATHAYSTDAQKIADSISFDPAERQPKATGPKKVAQKWIALATEIATRGEAVVSALATKLSEKLGLPVEPTVESLARAIAEDQRRIAAEAEKAAKAAYSV